VASGYTSGRCRPQGYSKAQHRLKCLGRCGLPDLFAQFDDAMSFATLSKAGLSRPYGTNFFLGPCERAKRHAARNGPSPSCISESRLTTVLHDMQGPCSSPLPNAHLQCLLLVCGLRFILHIDTIYSVDLTGLTVGDIRVLTAWQRTREARLPLIVFGRLLIHRNCRLVRVPTARWFFLGSALLSVLQPLLGGGGVWYKVL